MVRASSVRTCGNGVSSDRSSLSLASAPTSTGGAADDVVVAINSVERRTRDLRMALTSAGLRIDGDTYGDLRGRLWDLEEAVKEALVAANAVQKGSGER